MSCSAIAEPNWWCYRRLRYPGLPHRYHRWLRDGSSLTQRLIDVCDGHFRVRLQHQGWGNPLPSERKILDMGRARVAMVREVVLQCDERPLVFARTLIPAGSLKGAAARLAYLGERPLGAVLFSRPTTRRGAIEFARLLPGQPLYESAVLPLQQRPSELWGRRTLFCFEGKPLLVCEIFLPDVPSV